VSAAGAVGETGVGGSEGEVVAALDALGYSPAEGRVAAREAVANLGPEASLEERVKDALRALKRG